MKHTLHPQITAWLLAIAAGGGALTHAAEPADTTENDNIDTNLERSSLADDLSLLDKFSDSRERWKKAVGLDYSATYHTYFAAVMMGHDLPTGASGDLTLQGIWKPGHRWRDNPTELRFRARYRHAIGDTSASALGSEVGTLWGVVDGFSDSGFETPDFYLRHFFPQAGIELRYGQMTIDSQFDSHALRGSKQSFLNQAFSSNPAVAFPRFGVGITFAKKFKNGIDVTLGASNVQGTQDGTQVDFKFSSSALFEAVQVGYDFEGMSGRPSRLQMMVWRSDAVEKADRPEGEGVSLTAEQEIKGTDLRAFGRLAWSRGEAASLGFITSTGAAWKIDGKNLLGIGAGIGRETRHEPNVQTVLEAFYRWRPREGVHVSPDFQLIAGQGLRGSPGVRLLIGLRAGFDL